MSKRYGVDFFEDEFLEAKVDELVQAVNETIKETEQQLLLSSLNSKNKLDPFAAIFEAGVLSLDDTGWRRLEANRHINKKLTNSLGHLHQELIGNLPGWTSTGRSKGFIDLKHPEPFGVTGKRVFAELKNKHNTMNAGTAEKTYQNFEQLGKIPEYRNSTFYLIQVIQKKETGDVPWTIPGKPGREDIRIIGARELYEITTGDPNSLKRTFNALKMVLSTKYGLSSDPETLQYFEGTYDLTYPENKFLDI